TAVPAEVDTTSLSSEFLLQSDVLLLPLRQRIVNRGLGHRIWLWRGRLVVLCRGISSGLSRGRGLCTRTRCPGRLNPRSWCGDHPHGWQTLCQGTCRDHRNRCGSWSRGLSLYRRSSF
ncbi:hypothetical protein PIB30_103031, partial [Stylosanthes scabra]|nr:hypothetical protein [Stylosanthes scabra]